MGRVPTGKIPEQALTFIRPRHRQIMYRLITGQTQAHIATDLEMNQSRLSVIVNSPLFKSELRKMEDQVFESLKESRGDITTKVKELQPVALKVIQTIMENKVSGARLRRDCAKDILELDKKRRTNEDEGMTPFAKVIQEAFDLAHKNRESPDRDDAKTEPEIKNVTPGYEGAIETSIIEVGESTPYEEAEKSAKETDATPDITEGPETVKDVEDEDDGNTPLLGILDALGV